jgi:hypothetical protein
MSTSTAEAAGKQARSRTFRIVFWIEGVAYTIIPLKPDPEVASRAYRFLKRDGRGRATVNYDVHVNGHGPECECKGFLRWRKPCKHIKTLAAAGMIPPLPDPAAPSSEPQGGTGDGQA